MDQVEHFTELFKNLMPRAKFAHVYGFMYYKVADAVRDGRIAAHCIDGKIYINVIEALSVLRPSAVAVEKASESKDDLFA